MAQKKPSISVVIPAYNEAARIGPTIEKMCGYLDNLAGGYEILVVDDGSTDETAPLIKKLCAQQKCVSLIRYPTNAGKGHAVKTGVLASRGDFVLLCDADLSTPIEELDTLQPSLDHDCDIAIGSRGLHDSSILVRQSLLRQTMGKTFNLFVRTLVLEGIIDTQCGFKLFKGDVAREIFAMSCIQGFGFDVEILFLASKKKYRIKEVPVRWSNSPLSRVSLVRDPILMLIDLFRIRLNWFLGRYNSG